MSVLPRAVIRRAFVAVLLAGTVAAGGLVAAPAGAVNGDPVASGGHAFTARVQVGAQRSCSGALVAANWVLTAKSCFAGAAADAKPAGRTAARTGSAGRTAGPQKLPPSATVVTVGADDLTKTGGVRAQVTDLVEHPDRDVVLAELDAWIHNIQPIAIGTAAAVGERLRVTGYGRTSASWVPDTAHTTSVTAGESADTTLAVSGDGDKAPTCKGDAGGPTFRERDGKPELVALHHTTGLRGCLGAPDNATPSSTETRVDDLASWLTSSTDRKVLPASADRWIRPTGHMCTNRYGSRFRWDGQFLSVLDWAGKTRGGVITDNPGSEYLHFHSDGNLVVWKGGKQQWSSNTGGHPGARLECGDDWGVSIIDGDGRVLWQSGTGPVVHAMANLEYRGRPQPAPVCTSPNNQIRLLWNGSQLGVHDGAGRPRGRAQNWYLAGHTVRFQSDGNLVVWTDREAAWSSGTAGHPNARLICQDDGDVAIRDGNALLWRSGTSPQVPANANWRIGNAVGYACISSDSRTKLYWYAGELLSSDGWRSGSQGAAEGWGLRFQPDGNLVLHDKAGAVKWSTKTAGHPNAVLRCQDDGNIAILDGTTKLWDTNSRPTGIIWANTGPKLCISTVGGNASPPVETEVLGCEGLSLWTVESEGAIRGVFDSLCVDVQGAGTANGSKIVAYKCVGAPNQIWKRGANGSLVNPKSGKCLDVPGASTKPNTQLQLYTCNGSNAQRWTLPVPVKPGVLDPGRRRPGELDPGMKRYLKSLQKSRARR